MTRLTWLPRIHFLRAAEAEWRAENKWAREWVRGHGQVSGSARARCIRASAWDKCSEAGSRVQSLSPSLRWSFAPSLHREPTADQNYPSPAPAPAPALNKHAVQPLRAAAHPSQRISATFARPVKLSVFI